MFEELIQNKYVVGILKQYKNKDLLRVSCAVFIYGSKQLLELYPHINSDINLLEEIVYGSAQTPNNELISNKKELVMGQFFNELKAVKRALNNFKEKSSNSNTYKNYTERAQRISCDKENNYKAKRKLSSCTRTSCSPAKDDPNGIKKIKKERNKTIMSDYNPAAENEENKKSIKGDNRVVDEERLTKVGITEPLFNDKAKVINKVDTRSGKGYAGRNLKYYTHKASMKIHRYKPKQKDHNSKPAKDESIIYTKPVKPKQIIYNKIKIKDKDNDMKIIIKKNHDHSHNSLPKHNNKPNSCDSSIMKVANTYLNSSIINHFYKNEEKPPNKTQPINKVANTYREGKKIWEDKIIEEESSCSVTENNISATSYGSSTASITNLHSLQNKDDTKTKNKAIEFCLREKYNGNVNYCI